MVQYWRQLSLRLWCVRYGTGQSWGGRYGRSQRKSVFRRHEGSRWDWWRMWVLRREYLSGNGGGVVA